MNSFSQILFMNSLSPIFFYKLNITNSFSQINLRIRNYSKKFVQICMTLFWFHFAKSVLCCERPVLYVGFQQVRVLMMTEMEQKRTPHVSEDPYNTCKVHKQSVYQAVNPSRDCDFFSKTMAKSRIIHKSINQSFFQNYTE